MLSSLRRARCRHPHLYSLCGTSLPCVRVLHATRPEIPAQSHDALRGGTPGHDGGVPSEAPRIRRSKLQAYAALIRLQAPVGTTLLFLPCAQSILLAASQTGASASSTAGMLALFSTGAFLMRSAGCVINDLWDQDLDKQVSRTATRPIASGEISPREAFLFTGGLLSGGLLVLTQLNTYSIVLGAASMGLVVVYPLMKRVTYLPQLVLGLAFNWGALLGYPALAGVQAWDAVLPLYTAGISWTLIYDTIYAHQDARDDVKAGIKSTALLFGRDTTKVLSMLAIAQFGSLAYLSHVCDLGVGFATGSTLAAAYTAVMLAKLDIDDEAGCGRWFRRSQYVGWLIAGGLAVDYIASDSRPERGVEHELDRP